MWCALEVELSGMYCWKVMGCYGHVSSATTPGAAQWLSGKNFCLAALGYSSSSSQDTAWILHVFPVLVWVSFRFFGFLLHAGMLLVLFKIGPTVIIYWACPRWLPHHLLQQQIRDHMEKSATEILKLISFLAESTAGFHAQAEWQLLNGPQFCGNATSSVHIGPLYQ